MNIILYFYVTWLFYLKPRIENTIVILINNNKKSYTNKYYSK